MEPVVVTGDFVPAAREVERPRIVLIGMDPGISKAAIEQLSESYKQMSKVFDIDVGTVHAHQMSDFHMDDYDNRDCKLDHGERTNYKLKDQPFYMRGRNGKMRGW